MAENFKSGFVSIIGKTNVGKSTLINNLVGEKIAAVVNKSQTTRTAIRAIVNRENSQIVIIDTPGIHKPQTKLGKIMVDTAYKSSENVDAILFLVDAINNKIHKGDSIILEKLKSQNTPVILLINKIDLIKKEALLQIIKNYSELYEFKAIIPISALNKKYVKTILNEIEKCLPEGPPYYEKDEYTDQTERQLIEEIIREKLLKSLSDEVPHGTYVEVEKMELGVTKKEEDIYNIEATIYCIREGHKGIIIGKNGQMLKKIASASRFEIEKMLNKKVNLSVWVKVKDNWLNQDEMIKKFKL
ncbi:MAG: GTPase Era [Oscillospiraceae bacterium]|nr:GTPase Era [Oscillospiraceae bacterium]